MLLDEALYKTLSPVFGERNVYAALTSDILPREGDRNFTPFCIFEATGGRYYPSFERVYDTEKDNYDVVVTVFSPRMVLSRQLSLKARMAILQSPYFLAVERLENLNDRVEWMNKIYGCRQDLSLWIKNDPNDLRV